MSLHWTEEEYARYVGKGVTPPPIPEAAFQAAVIRLAKDAGYLVYFTKDSRRSPSGFPDLVLAKAGDPLILTELKTDIGQVTPAQEAWLSAIAGSVGVVAEAWRPRDWDTIRARLSR